MLDRAQLLGPYGGRSMTVLVGGIAGLWAPTTAARTTVSFRPARPFDERFLRQPDRHGQQLASCRRRSLRDPRSRNRRGEVDSDAGGPGVWVKLDPAVLC